MTLGAPYATLNELKGRLHIPLSDTSEDDLLNGALAGASLGIETHCRRQFNDAGTASARLYHRVDPCLAHVDDFHTTSGLVVKTDGDGDGVFETTWTAADYQLEPLNGVRDGVPGWPYWKVVAVGTRSFPCSRRAVVEVTAQWGWAAVPASIKEACLIVSSELFKLDAPFGIARFEEFGLIRIRDNPLVEKKLQPFRRARRSAAGVVLVEG